tara:strand:- start:539 stop:1015 length:477 start_codon:yes stop_codon:yes gene_type:complete
MNYRKALIGEEEYENIILNQKNDQNPTDSIDNTIKTKLTINHKKVSKVKKPSDELIQAQTIMIKDCLPSSELIEEMKNDISHILKWSKVINLSFDNDEIVINSDGEKKFSRKKFCNSPYFMKELKNEYVKLLEVGVYLKFLKSSENNNFRLLIKSLEL